MSRGVGQIIKRGENKYLVRIFLGTNELTGKRIYHNHTVRGVKKDAEKYKVAKLRELDLGSFIEPTKKDYRRMFRYVVQEHSAQHYAKDSGQLSGAFRPQPALQIGETRLTGLQADEIQSVYAEMMKRGLGARSIRHTYVVLNAVLEEKDSSRRIVLHW